VANRREEERQRLREAREQRESKQDKSGQRRLIAVYAVCGLIGLLVVAGIVMAIASSGGGGGSDSNAHLLVSTGETNGFQPDGREGTAPAPVKITDLDKAAKAAGCVVRLELKDEGHNHLPPTAPTPDYKTNPPTSGDHATAPYQQADGAYSEMPDEIFIVHSLEHGRMQIQYSPDLSEDEQLELKGLYDTMFGGTLFFPNTNMDYEVAATTWTNLLGCPEYKGAVTLDAIRAFGKETWGKYGGEPVNAFGLKGPTPFEPAA
jgi:Protein of unknown function (DUF3105)